MCTFSVRPRMLVAEGLTKSYREQEVVHGVSLRLVPGRIVGLVGNNGAGKTTTLKMLAGLLQPQRGTVLLEGIPTLEPRARARLGYLPEESPLYEDMTPLAYLAFFGGLYNVPRKEARDGAERLLKRLALPTQSWKKPIGTLSKGQRRKVAIARCLLHDPAVLILDEPTSGLDPGTMEELDGFLAELRDEGRAILLSAHNLPQVEELCDEILIMHQGNIVRRGTLAELRAGLGPPRYRVRATTPFPGSGPRGQSHEGLLGSIQAVEATLEHVRKAGGVVIEVESEPPRLEEILRKASEA